MSDLDYFDDPNAPSQQEVVLKRVEAAIRRRGDADLLLMFDGICLETDETKRNNDLVALTRLLADRDRK